MKILCICERGNSRSVALAWILKDHLGHDAVAIGAKSAGRKTLKMLCKWADKIILVDKDFKNEIPLNQKKKLKIWVLK